MYKKIIVSLFLFLFSIGVLAAQSPDVMLQQVSTQLLTQLVNKRSEIKSNQGVLYRIIQDTLIPHVDLNVMSRSVVGNNYWETASNDQREEFKRQFTRFVTRTYSSAFQNYRDEKVLFYPIRGGVGNQTRVQVQSKIMRDNGQDVPMSYRLYLTGDAWKVYDISVEGVSMIQSYRSQFADVLAQKGFAGLIQDLQARNRSVQ